MPGKIFINYRRIESLKDARHLATLLDKGPFRGRIFIDTKGLDGSPDWLHELERQVAASEAMVAVICPDWVNVRDAGGRRRIDSDRDFVRFELAEAFRRGIPVIPVLVDGARMPRGSELPDNLLLLTRPQAELLRAESFDDDAGKIARRVQADLAARRVRGWPGRAVAAIAVVALAGGVAVGSSVPERLGWPRPMVTDADAAGRIARLRAELADAKAEIGRLASARDAVVAEAKRLAGVLLAAEKALDSATARADGLEKQAAALQARVSALSAQLASLKRSPAAPAPPEVPAADLLRPGRVFRDCKDVCPEMVVLPSGEFMMGSNEYDDEKPARRVTIARPFAVGKFEVTFTEWDACVAGGGCKHQPGDENWGRGKRPVINVSWYDAKEYMGWLSRKTGKSYRLLSEAEWEYAARAGTTTRYSFGDAISKAQAQFRADKTVEVGSFPANRFGLHDMHGNVWEWVEDNWHPNYQGAPVDGSVWQSGDVSLRVLRGGSWAYDPQNLRSAIRYWDRPDYRRLNIGFRVARTL